MTLIKSISGIRGTIGGYVGKSLTPIDVVKYTAAYATFLKSKKLISNTIIVGRDARISGELINNLVTSTLISCGFDVIDIGLTTTPTVEIAVELNNCDGGIIITASHNPIQWNALKLLNNNGEFISENDGNEILNIAEKDNICFEEIHNIGKISYDNSFNDIHIDKILNLDLVEVELIKSMNYTIVLDGVNSTGGIIIPKLLNKLGVNVIKLYCEPTGIFPHNPEPLEENLTDISRLVVNKKADFGIVVDPDVDRLAFVCEDGIMFGEEYTLVAVADYILSKKTGNTVSNLSSSRALKDITEKYGSKYYASAVGEVNVVEMMKNKNAIIGGEGNGGIIYPDLHYGRDALVGLALFLSYISEKKQSLRTIKRNLPQYFIYKNKIDLDINIDLNMIFEKIKQKYNNENITSIDGLKIDFSDGWVHLRKSNTEPIIRIYSESNTIEKAKLFSNNMLNEIKKMII
tara:strand:- start:5119 stop:6501 length:1383 start_codon:yes stop_codon:yes gene_type:complete